MTEPVPTHERARLYADNANAEPVYVLVGKTTADPDPAAETFRWEFAPGQSAAEVVVLLPLFEYLRKPRSESKVLDWLDAEWLPRDDGSEAIPAARFLASLAHQGVVARIDARNPATAAKSLKHIRVIADCVPVADATALHDALVVERADDPTSQLIVTVELAEALWGREQHNGIHAAAKALSAGHELPLIRVQRRVLSDVPMLLLHGYAHLKWLDGPPHPADRAGRRAKRTAAIARRRQIISNKGNSPRAGAAPLTLFDEDWRPVSAAS